MSVSAGEAGVQVFYSVPLTKMETLNKLKQFDAYPKTLEDFRVKTWGGATGERHMSTYTHVHIGF